MAGPVPAIHAFCRVHEGKAWMAGTGPAMTGMGGPCEAVENGSFGGLVLVQRVYELPGIA